MANVNNSSQDKLITKIELEIRKVLFDIIHKVKNNLKILSQYKTQLILPFQISTKIIRIF